MIGQILRHKLSFNGEIVEGFGIDVPYPDEVWNKKYVDTMSAVFQNYGYLLQRKTAILVEAVVIRGRPRTFRVRVRVGLPEKNPTPETR
jgi:hypothetical protein